MKKRVIIGLAVFLACLGIFGYTLSQSNKSEEVADIVESVNSEAPEGSTTSEVVEDSAVAYTDSETVTDSDVSIEAQNTGSQESSDSTYGWSQILEDDFLADCINTAIEYDNFYRELHVSERTLYAFFYDTDKDGVEEFVISDNFENSALIYDFDSTGTVVCTYAGYMLAGIYNINDEPVLILNKYDSDTNVQSYTDFATGEVMGSTQYVIGEGYSGLIPEDECTYLDQLERINITDITDCVEFYAYLLEEELSGESENWKEYDKPTYDDVKTALKNMIMQ